MNRTLHPLSSIACIIASAALLVTSLYAEIHTIDVPPSIQSGPVKPAPAPTLPATETATAPAADQVRETASTAAECPAYAQALADSHQRRTLVIVTFLGCPPCAAQTKDLEKAGVPFTEVIREKHPATFASFHASLFPTWYVLRNGSTVASGANRMPAAFFKQILQEDGQ